jgi:hypothetical protein
MPLANSEAIIQSWENICFSQNALLAKFCDITFRKSQHKIILLYFQTIDGWYYLLHEDIARRKHVQAIARQPISRQGHEGRGQKVTERADDDDADGLYATIGHPVPTCLKSKTLLMLSFDLRHQIFEFHLVRKKSPQKKQFHNKNILNINTVHYL